MKTVRLGIVGMGGMGTTHFGNAESGGMPEIEVVAVADRKEARRRIAVERKPGVAVFAEGSELIDSGTCDAVLIAVPHYQHPELSIRALSRGLHVMCEKPAGVYTKQVRLMNEAADRSDRVFALMFNQRTLRVHRKMHELVTGGAYGAIKRVNWIVTDWYRTQRYYDSGAWRATWAGEGGGVLLNQCPHNLDLLQWICGMPSRVQAFCHEGKWHDIEVEDDVTAYLEFPGGATGVFVTSTGDTPGTNRFEILLERARLVCENDALSVWELDESERTFCRTATSGFGEPKATFTRYEYEEEGSPHAAVMNAFAARILRGEPLVATGQEGIRSLAISNAMHLSSWLQRPVTLPPDEDLFLRELDARRARSRHKADEDVVLDLKGSY